MCDLYTRCSHPCSVTSVVAISLNQALTKDFYKDTKQSPMSPPLSMQKLRTRLSLFHSEKCPNWSSQRKERIKYILSKGLDYVSSEDSGDDEKTISRRLLRWLKPKYHKSLRQLDKIDMNSLSPRAKRMYRKRIDGEPAREPPSDAPEYVLSSVDLNSSTASDN